MSYSTIWRANEAREVLGLSTYQRNGRKYIWARQMRKKPYFDRKSPNMPFGGLWKTVFNSFDGFSDF